MLAYVTRDLLQRESDILQGTMGDELGKSALSLMGAIRTAHGALAVQMLESVAVSMWRGGEAGKKE
jgi:hypothetical protein